MIRAKAYQTGVKVSTTWRRLGARRGTAATAPTAIRSTSLFLLLSFSLSIPLCQFLFLSLPSASLCLSPLSFLLSVLLFYRRGLMHRQILRLQDIAPTTTRPSFTSHSLSLSPCLFLHIYHAEEI